MPLRNFYLAATFLLILGACTTKQQPVQQPLQPDMGTGTGADIMSGANMLSYVDNDSFGQPCTHPCSKIGLPTATIAVPVRYTRSDGQPISGKVVQYTTTVPGNMGKLSAFNAMTDPNGVTTVGLNLYAQALGTYQVTASIPGDPAAGQLAFQIIIAVDEKSPLIVQFNYTGQQPVTQFYARLFLQNGNAPSCGDISPDAPVIGVQPSVNAGPKSFNEYFVFDSLPNLQAAGAQMWTVQIVTPNAGPIQAVGCEANVTLKFNETRTINISVNDLPLIFNGNHKITSLLDIQSGLQGGAADIMGTIIGLFTDPGGTIIKKACEGTSGVLGLACDQLVDSNGELKQGNGTNVAAAASSAFFDLIKDELGSNVLNGGQTIAELFKNLRLGSTMALLGEPTVWDNDGITKSYAPGTATEVWETASFYWKFGLNCPPNDEFCGLQTIKLLDVYQQPLGVQVMPVIDEQSRLGVPSHVVPGFAYGVLVNFLLEKKVLPLLFGDGSDGLPAVDSYEKLVGMTLGNKQCIQNQNCCDVFEQKMNNQFGKGSAIALGLGLYCGTIISNASNWLRNNLIGIDGDLTVGTPDALPCPAFDHTSDRAVDNLGAFTVPEQCHWDMTWQLSGEPFKPNARWYGKK